MGVGIYSPNPWPCTTDTAAHENYFYAFESTVPGPSTPKQVSIPNPITRQVPRIIPGTWPDDTERIETRLPAPTGQPTLPNGSTTAKQQTTNTMQNLTTVKVQSIPGQYPSEEPRCSSVSNASSQGNRSSLQQPSRNNDDEPFFDNHPMRLQTDNMMAELVPQQSHVPVSQRLEQKDASKGSRTREQPREQRTSSARITVFDHPLAATESTGWKACDAPQELLHSMQTSSQEIKDLLNSSIRSIVDQHAQSLEREEQARSDVANNRASAFSLDSGYSSATLETEKKSKGKKALNGLASLFRRKDGRSIPSIADAIGISRTGMVIGLDRSLNLIPPVRQTPSIRAPVREAPAVPESVSFPPPSAAPSVPTPESLVSECASCLEDFSSAQVIKLSCHSYCSTCFEGLICAALTLEAQWPPKCCLKPIPSTAIIMHLPAHLITRYTAKDMELKIPAADRVHCSRANCNIWIAPKNITKASNSAKCPTCNQRTCTICRGQAHNGQDCPDDPNLRATDNLAKTEGWQKCYSCHAYVEHNNGCRHMTCRCRAEFCYVCGLRWRTCDCSESDLTTALVSNNVRRQARATACRREGVAMAARNIEERELVRQVEEYERQEAEQRAREAEQERLEAARRAEAEQRRQEEHRIAQIHRRFANFRMELESLHDIQRVLVAERHELEDERLRLNFENGTELMMLRHTTEVQLLNAESQSKVSDTNYRFQMECRARQAEGRKIDEKYIEDLITFYAGNEGADQNIRDAFERHRAEEERAFAHWDKMRRAQLHTVAETERRKMAQLGEAHRSERAEVESEDIAKRQIWKTKCDADTHWVDMVIAERERVLDGMEQDDYARDI